LEEAGPRPQLPENSSLEVGSQFSEEGITVHKSGLWCNELLKWPVAGKKSRGLNGKGKKVGQGVVKSFSTTPQWGSE
jgi:hypothetical protein